MNECSNEQVEASASDQDLQDPLFVFDRTAFVRFCTELSLISPRQSTDYFKYHLQRLWTIYQESSKAIGDQSGCVVSVGAGSAYVEAALVESLGCYGVVIDLPEAVSGSRSYYDRCRLHPYEMDIATIGHIELTDVPPADLVISSEIVEHLPSPPSQHFSALRPLLALEGTILVATPNAGSIRKTLKTLLHKPILPPAELTFGPVSIENEGVHRREYMALEIKNSLSDAGYELRSKRYINYNFTRAMDLAFLPLEGPIPQFREGLLVTAVLR